MLTRSLAPAPSQPEGLPLGDGRGASPGAPPEEEEEAAAAAAAEDAALWVSTATAVTSLTLSLPPVEVVLLASAEPPPLAAGGGRGGHHPPGAGGGGNFFPHAAPLARGAAGTVRWEGSHHALSRATSFRSSAETDAAPPPPPLPDLSVPALPAGACAVAVLPRLTLHATVAAGLCEAGVPFVTLLADAGPAALHVHSSAARDSAVFVRAWALMFAQVRCGEEWEDLVCLSVPVWPCTETSVLKGGGGQNRIANVP